MNNWAYSFSWIFVIAIIISIFLLLLLNSKKKVAFGFFLFFFIPTLIVWVLNLYCFPGKEERYIADVKYSKVIGGVAPMEQMAEWPVGEPIHLQIRITVESHSHARRFFHDNRIPVTITISNPDIAEYQVQLARNFEEIKAPQTDNNTTTYYFAIYAQKPPEYNWQIGEKEKLEPAIITFVGTAQKKGAQTVRIQFDKKVSGKYNRIDTLTYVDY